MDENNWIEIPAMKLHELEEAIERLTAERDSLLIYIDKLQSKCNNLQNKLDDR
jgi:predicted RNase H-like nuclease (RuvC/YqgF family)